MPLPSSPVHVVLALLSDLPSVAALAEGARPVIPLTAEARAWPYLVFADEHADVVHAAVAKCQVVKPYEKLPKRVPAELGADVQGLTGEVMKALEAAKGLYLTSAEGYFSTACFAIDDASLEKVEQLLTKAKLTSVRAATLTTERKPESKAATAARIEQALAEAPEKFRVGFVAHLLGKGPLPKNTKQQSKEHVLTSGLGPDAERWNPEVAERLLRVWLSVREAHESLFLDDDDGAPPLGVGRTRALFELLLKAGAKPGLAHELASSTSSSSPYPYQFVATPEVLEAAYAESPSLAWSLTAKAVGAVYLASSPSYVKHLRALAASHSPALGAEALYKLSDNLVDALDFAHLELAAKDPEGEKLQWAAAKVEAASKKNVGAVAVALKAWSVHAQPAQVSAQLNKILRDEKRPMVVNAAWEALAAVLDARAAAPFKQGDQQHDDFLFAFAKLVKPGKAVAARIATWLASPHAAQLDGYHRKTLERKVGKAPKLAPLPYSATDLRGLAPAQAKAWQTAREKSWKAGVKLPRGVAEKALVAAEKTLGATLPADVRSFYLLHDGAGDDECFNGCRLYSLKDAVAQRQTLLDYAKKGAHPFDASWLPLTDDGAGNHHCVVLSGKAAGHVVDFDHETGAGRRLAPTFSAFVQRATWED